MRISVLYFAAFRERIGAPSQVLELAAGARVADAIDALATEHAAVAGLRGRFRVAVNQEFVADEQSHALADGDELALIPPVAGGADVGDVGTYIAVIGEPLSLDRCIAAVLRAGEPGAIGGVVTFTGLVRRHNKGHAVDHLEYEAYEAMAVRELAAVCAGICDEIADVRLAVEHRVGRLTIGDLAVVIAAAAPHRGEAFAACRALIDRLKERVPIWKKEVGDGGEEWIGLGP